jgi:hypothetical protein
MDQDRRIPAASGSKVQRSPMAGIEKRRLRLLSRHLRMSRRTVALSLPFVVGGVVLMFVPWSHGPVAGALVAGLGLVVFFAAGYYWGSESEREGFGKAAK